MNVLEQSSLGMLPTLVDHLDAVAIRIEKVGGVVARIIVKASAWWTVVGCAGRDRGCVDRVDFVAAPGDAADMDGAPVGVATVQPKVDSPITAESLQIGMTFRSVGTIIINAPTNAERRQRLFVKN